MKKILLPTDFSDVAGYALDFAHKIATKIQAKIHVLKVISAPIDIDFDKEGNIIENKELDLSSLYNRLEDNQMLIEHWTKNIQIDVENHVKIGNLYDDILGFSKRLAVDLIIMGTSGTSGTKEFMVGSNTENIVRNANVPVLSIKTNLTNLNFQNILLVSDFAHPDKEHLSILKTIQETFNAKLHLLRIDKNLTKSKEKKYKERMQNFVQINALENVAYHFYEDKGVEQGVLNFAEEFNMDMIVVGTHGRKGFAHLFFGSIAEDMVNHIQKPILTFKLS